MPINEINKINLYHEIQGEGYPIVFTHGFTATHQMWEPQIHIISAKYKFLIYDVRGHGKSECPESIDQYSADIVVEDLYQLLKFHGIEKAVVGGLSMVRMITKNNGKIARNLQGISGLGQKFPRLSSK